jgi:N-acetylmuramoyl-L-alanine amidase
VTTIKRLTVGALILLSGLARNADAQRSGVAALPVPPARAPLLINVAYPAAGSTIDFGDSTFIFGTVGDDSATLTIAGQPVAVAPNGAWLAWVSLPHDSNVVVALVAHRGQDSAISTLHFLRAGWVRQTGAWVDPVSRAPVGDVWLPKDEPLPLTVRAAPGALVRLLMPGGRALRFVADSIAAPPLDGLRSFDRDDRNLRGTAVGDRYVATLRGELSPGYDGVEVPRGYRLPAGRRGAGPPILEISLHGKTTRLPWPLHVTRSAAPPVAVVLDDDPMRQGGTDRITIGRTFPTGTYTWFLPQGTRTRADMRLGDQVRLRLSRDAIAWVPATDVHLAAATDDARPAIMGSPTLTAAADRTGLRIPLTRPVPLRVEETDRGLAITLFDAVSDANWTRYGADQRFVQAITWTQDAEDRVAVGLTLDPPLWGWRAHVDGTDLVIDVRMPPVIDPDQPLRGRRIVIDPGHPPGGACGPTGLCEPEANLNIGAMVRDQLIAAGATVIMTRSGPEALGLWPRVALADSIDAELLVSIHNNALPDGVNPFTNNGTSTFFNHPHSLGLARTVQLRLVANLGLRDLGVARGDLALTRPTWYPAILTEGLFMMVPEQEAALRTTDGQRRYATGVVAGIAAFLKEVSQSRRRP